MANFSLAYRRTSIYEGGYANVKGDRGGETYAGIARNFHPNWRGWAIIDKYKPLKYNAKLRGAAIEQLVQQFYIDNFWTKIRGNDINDQLIAEFVYDYAVHSGVTRAVTKLQQALGFTGKDLDGKIGPNTIGKTNAADPKALIQALKRERAAFLTALSTRPGQAKFKKGWLSRVNSF